MNYQNLLLFLMLSSYSYPIYIVTKSYNENTTTVSNIICNIENTNITFSFYLMGFFTLLYEYSRNDNLSLFYIFILLIALIGLLNTIDYSLYHLYFAITAFFSIFTFMFHNSSRIKNYILETSLFFEIIICLYIVLSTNIEKCVISERARKELNIFIPELLLISNFGFFYIYLHYLEFMKIKYD
jgi:lysylphosphatidylglycerol synthetase-like protein (DUF2156 family)